MWSSQLKRSSLLPKRAPVLALIRHHFERALEWLAYHRCIRGLKPHLHRFIDCIIHP